MENYTGSSPLNLSVGEDVSIRDLANILINLSGFQGQANYDLSKQDGMAIKLLDGSELKNLGWRPSISIEDGLDQTNKWFVENHL
jgi:nucleoside-diphosphate-sugar epimerase